MSDSLDSYIESSLKCLKNFDTIKARSILLDAEHEHGPSPTIWLARVACIGVAATISFDEFKLTPQYLMEAILDLEKFKLTIDDFPESLKQPAQNGLSGNVFLFLDSFWRFTLVQIQETSERETSDSVILRLISAITLSRYLYNLYSGLVNDKHRAILAESANKASRRMAAILQRGGRAELRSFLDPITWTSTFDVSSLVLLGLNHEALRIDSARHCVNIAFLLSILVPDGGIEVFYPRRKQSEGLGPEALLPLLQIAFRVASNRFDDIHSGKYIGRYTSQLIFSDTPSFLAELGVAHKRSPLSKKNLSLTKEIAHKFYILSVEIFIYESESKDSPHCGSVMNAAYLFLFTRRISELFELLSGDSDRDFVGMIREKHIEIERYCRSRYSDWDSTLNEVEDFDFIMYFR